MRITMLTSSYPRFPGDGAAPFVQSIAEALTDLGHAVEVIAPDDVLVARRGAGRPAKIDENQTAICVHHFRYFWPRKSQIMGYARALAADTSLRPAAYWQLPFFLLAEFITLMRVTRQQKTDWIYVHWVLPNGPAAALVAKIRRIPLAISLHGSDMYVAGKSFSFGAVARWCFKPAKVVTACSPELRHAALQLGAPTIPRLLAWGVDVKRFQPQARDGSLRANYNLPQGNRIVATLGRLVPKKGFAVLLRAWAELASEFPAVRIIIGGEGVQRNELQILALQLGIQNSVIFTGQIPWNETPSFLAQVDIFVLPSRPDQSGNRDGLPTVLLEAMSCGLPVIASQIGGVEMVIADAVNGLLCPPGDAKALAQKMRLLLQNPQARAQLGDAARQHVIQYHTWQHVARELDSFFAASSLPSQS